MPMPSYADRDVQFPMRFKFTKVQGTEDQYDLTPVPGTITNAGTQLNKSFFDAVKAAIEEMAVADGGITTAKLANGAVTAAKLAALAVATSSIQDGAVTSGKMANDAVLVNNYYTGGGSDYSNPRLINLGFRPKAVFLIGYKYSGDQLEWDDGKGNVASFTFHVVINNPRYTNNCDGIGMYLGGDSIELLGVSRSSFCKITNNGFEVNDYLDVLSANYFYMAIR